MVRYLDKGEIDPRARATCELRAGVLERWDGHRGFGPLNARRAMERACVLAKENGVGLVALGNNNHWLRGGTYGWLAADRGFIGICWSNTMPNMPAWGGKTAGSETTRSFGVASLNGEHVVWTAQYPVFLRKIEDCGCGACSCPCRAVTMQRGTDARPAEIETGRVLPMGYWKGSGLSIVLDLIATVLGRQFGAEDRNIR
ncbi:MAG: Ldh family oxidoreductase [Ruthenibacterium lactatiformans]